jgi:hypothetical protein
LRRASGRFFCVPACVTLSPCRPLFRGVHGRIADGVRALSTVGVTVGFLWGAALTAYSGLACAAGRACIPPSAWRSMPLAVSSPSWHPARSATVCNH